jgi:hypothetical protein
LPATNDEIVVRVRRQITKTDNRRGFPLLESLADRGLSLRSVFKKHRKALVARLENWKS